MTAIVEHTQAIENKAATTATAFGWFRKALPLQIVLQYWRDVHGVRAARIPGLYQYRQLHLSPVKPSTFAPVAQIAYDLPREDQPNGLAQLLFLTQQDVETFGSHPFVTRYIREDEQNLCDRNAHQWSRDHSAHTVKDITNESEPQGPPTHPAFVIGLQKQQQHPVAAFNEFIVGTLAPAWTGMQEVLRLRYHLLEPYVEHEGQSPNVAHDWADVKQYQAWIELSVRDERRAHDLLTVVTENELRTHLRAVHAYPIFDRYTLVYNGRPTDVGYRGYPATQIIKQIDARNQRSGELLSALYDHPPARKRLNG